MRNELERAGSGAPTALRPTCAATGPADLARLEPADILDGLLLERDKS